MRDRFCTDCDEMRAALLEGVESPEEQNQIWRQHPRKATLLRDVDGTPLCERCLQYRQADRQVAEFEDELPELEMAGELDTD